VRAAIDPKLFIIEREKNHHLLGQCICALGMYGEARFYPVIVKFTKHPKKILRKRVVKALMHIDHPDVVNALLSMAFHDPSKQVRESALKTVSLIGNSKAVIPLVNEIQGKDNIDRRLEYITALGKLGVIESEQALARLTQVIDTRISDKAKIVLTKSSVFRNRDTSNFFERQRDSCFYVY